MLTFSTGKKQSPTTRPHHDSMSGTSHPQHPKIRQILRRSSIQPKLTIGASNDKYEQEADRVADQVIRMREPSDVDPIPSDLKIQRMCQECEEEVRRQPLEEEEEEELQAKEMAGQTPKVMLSLESGINSLKGGGRPLSRSERRFFEPRFGEDFSNVRVHNDTRAACVARSVNARAFYIGA